MFDSGQQCHSPYYRGLCLAIRPHFGESDVKLSHRPSICKFEEKNLFINQFSEIETSEYQVLRADQQSWNGKKGWLLLADFVIKHLNAICCMISCGSDWLRTILHSQMP